MLKRYVVIYVSKLGLDNAVVMALNEESAVENDVDTIVKAFTAGYNSDHYYF